MITEEAFNDVVHTENLLELCVMECSVPGLMLEFGVWKGRSIRRISEATHNRHTIYGFDTFEGVDEPWKIADGNVRDMKSFRIAKPEVPDNVELVVGLIQDTLPPFLKEHRDYCRFINIDTDIYSSAKFILEQLDHRIVPGTIIHFDELLDCATTPGRYSNYHQHEWKALLEWMGEYGRNCEPIGRLYRPTNWSCGAAIRVID